MSQNLRERVIIFKIQNLNRTYLVVYFVGYVDIAFLQEEFKMLIVVRGFL